VISNSPPFELSAGPSGNLAAQEGLSMQTSLEHRPQTNGPLGPTQSTHTQAPSLILLHWGQAPVLQTGFQTGATLWSPHNKSILGCSFGQKFASSRKLAKGKHCHSLNSNEMRAQIRVTKWPTRESSIWTRQLVDSNCKAHSHSHNFTISLSLSASPTW